MISEESLRYLAEAFNGDRENLFSYKSGPMIYYFFNRFFGYQDTYTYNEPHPSRWAMTYNKLIDLINSNRLNDFFNIILNLPYLRNEFNTLSNEDLMQKQNEIMVSFNRQFAQDNYRLVKTNDAFRLEEIRNDEILLGSGGFADCYFINSLGVVEKRLKPNFYTDQDIVSRFKREFNITKELQEIPGIIRVFSLDENKLSYTMERGECDLESYIENNDLTDDFKFRIIYQILDTMFAVHQRNTFHRDLSPNNILLFSGLFKISDFGLGKNINEQYSHVTEYTQGVGNFLYCDPRQIKRLSDGDFLSDIYSLGRIINFILTKDPTNTNHILRSVVEKATNDKAELRFQNVESFRNSVNNVLASATDLEKKEKAEKKLLAGQFDVEVVSQVIAFSGSELFKKIQDYDFRKQFCDLLQSDIMIVCTKQDTIVKLAEYSENHMRDMVFKESDALGYLAEPLLLSDHLNFPTKELAIRLLNIPLKMDRFSIEKIVKDDILGNIEPALEKEIYTAKSSFIK
jgi:serine/threonine protein kinase